MSTERIPADQEILFDEDEVVVEVELPVVFIQDDDDLEYGALPPTATPVASQSQKSQIPDAVANFLRNLATALSTKNVWELHQLYENSFSKLSDKFYAKTNWPAPEKAVAASGSSDPVFAALYKDLYYRHVYAKLAPSLDDRIASYNNYPLDLELPNQWIWDIIDEFIYQFQAFCQWRSKGVKGKEADVLKERPDVWNVLNVLNVLYSLIQKSTINEQLWVSKHGGDMAEATGVFGARPLYRMLGYFSIVGLCRIHCLLGDYTMALKALENIELNKKGLFARVTACHITTYYYVGFSYLMMRRYSDAIKAFTHILLFISRTKQYHSRSYQYEVIQKKGEQMYALLTICLALCPQRIDENVHSLLREKYGDQLNKMQKEYVAAFPFSPESLIISNSSPFRPKFISPTASPSDTPTTAHSQQLRTFLTEVRQHHHISTIRSYLKLYTSLPLSKLASFRRWEHGSVLEGEYSSPGDLDFYMRGDMVFISESKVERRIGEWFVRQIGKFEDTLGP
ncbi:hypothetical protein BCR33DRAFT_714808 [Rhizoclosmatium globosum]|uniref:Eukaryotic translation initiation factor 3 subunit L n=1 Tax=Rhizoclosmatium globosum TaxID=329046 RepID=A0A1Y2CLJ2_9FUNG|nr:hypothetical protein BCR33DRAFT_714808 [Rhizoclosmatium globosum]|eukprot:ORY47734.1 hypothetical protein BCR33DRAFT_714808 [Rhizoclosmatium globosum]